MKRGRSDEDNKHKKGSAKRATYVAPPPGVFKSPAFQAAVAANMRRLGSRHSLYKDAAAATYAMNTTGSIQTLVDLAQGTSQQQRIGKRAFWKNIQVRGLVQSDSTTAIAHGAWMLVYDKRPHPSGTMPSITDVLESASSLAFTKADNHDRFSILCRRQYVFLGTTTPSTGKEAYDVNEFVKVNRKVVFKSAATGALADIEEGAIYLVTIGNLAAGTNDANATLAFRFTFRDVEG